MSERDEVIARLEYEAATLGVLISTCESDLHGTPIGCQLCARDRRLGRLYQDAIRLLRAPAEAEERVALLEHENEEAAGRIEALEAERDEARANCDLLHGLKFSERNHRAILARAEGAEAEVRALRARVAAPAEETGQACPSQTMSGPCTCPDARHVVGPPAAEGARLCEKCGKPQGFAVGIGYYCDCVFPFDAPATAVCKVCGRMCAHCVGGQHGVDETQDARVCDDGGTGVCEGGEGRHRGRDRGPAVDDVAPAAEGARPDVVDMRERITSYERLSATCEREGDHEAASMWAGKASGLREAIGLLASATPTPSARLDEILKGHVIPAECSEGVEFVRDLCRRATRGEEGQG